MDRQARDEMVERLQHENAAMLADVMARRERDLLLGSYTAPAKAVRSEDDHHADVNEIITARLASFLDTLADLTGEHTSEILEPVLVRLVAAETEIIRLRGLLGGGSTRAIGLVTRDVA